MPAATGLAQTDQLRELQSQLIPNPGGGTDAFHAGSGRLRPEYGWYLPAVRNPHVFAVRITELGDNLIMNLRQSAEPMIRQTAIGATG